MVGGGPRLSPGEVTLADQGVLFLDELPEFGRDVLEALRQPLEEGRVAIARVGRATTFPARFQFVAAMNPCPCGYAGRIGPDAAPARHGVPERYQRRVSGPLRDRIDLWVTMPRVAALALVGGPEPEDSATVGRRIAAARATAARWAAAGDNGRLSGRSLRAACRLSATTERVVVQLAELERASGRGTERLLRVARTIADLAGDDGRARGPPRRGGLVPTGGPPPGCRGGRLRCSGVSASGPVAAASATAGRPWQPDGPAPPARRTPGPRDRERNAWAVLVAVDGLGPVGFSALLRRYRTGVAILDEAASPEGVTRLAATPFAR